LNNKYEATIPLVLMNSFNTDEEMQRVLVKYESVNVLIEIFQQTKHPRLNKETLLPIINNLDMQSGSEGLVVHHWNSCCVLASL